MPRGIPSPSTWDASPRGFINGQAPGKFSSKRFVRLRNSCLSGEVVNENSIVH